MDQEKVFCEDSERKEAFLDHKNIGSRNHQNLHFSKGSMVFVKKWRFFNLLCLFIMDQEKVFCEVLERKEAFLTIKTSAKNEHFLMFCSYAKWIKKIFLFGIFANK